MTLRQLPSIAEALSELSWEQLRPIAERHGIAISGRRREPLIARLSAALLDPAHLKATVEVLPPGARALLGLLVLRGGSGQLSEVDHWRQRLRAARPDLDPMLARLRPATDAAVLAGLGLCARSNKSQRRGEAQLLVPAELLDGLPRLVPAAVARGNWKQMPTFVRVYALVRRLAGELARSTPSPLRGQEQASSLALPDHELALLGQTLALEPPQVALWLDLLGRLGVLKRSGGRVVLDAPRWSAISAPNELLGALLRSWQTPPASDQARALRPVLWRAIAALGAGCWDSSSLAATLDALDLVPPGEAGEPAHAGPVDSAAAPVGVGLQTYWSLMDELHTLGLVTIHDGSFSLSTSLLPPSGEEAEPHVSIGDQGLIVAQMERLDSETFRLLEALGSAEFVAPDALRWTLTRSAIARLSDHGGSVDRLVAALEPHTALPAELLDQLRAWEASIGSLELHYPVPVLVARDRDTLEHIIGAAGLQESIRRLGDRAAAVEPSEADAIFERLQRRGFWPRRDSE